MGNFVIHECKESEEAGLGINAVGGGDTWTVLDYAPRSPDGGYVRGISYCPCCGMRLNKRPVWRTERLEDFLRREFQKISKRFGT